VGVEMQRKTHSFMGDGARKVGFPQNQNSKERIRHEYRCTPELSV
jgi:hypothetical protein